MLDFKFRVMKWKGYKLIEPPIMAQSNFLANMGGTKQCRLLQRLVGVK